MATRTKKVQEQQEARFDWVIIICNRETSGELDRETLEGKTEEEALTEGIHWVAEGMAVTGEQQEVLIFRGRVIEDRYCVYQGSFGLRPDPDMWANVARASFAEV